jgi:hypothetical protein
MNRRGVRYCIGLLIGLANHSMAAQLPVKLWTEVSSDGDLWKVVPRVEAAAGSALRYQIVAKKTGHSGSSNTKQSGNLAVGSDGTGTLASLKIGVATEDQCDIDVKVYSGNEVVGNLTLRLPR